MNQDAFVFKNKLIMVMGLQRSGTSALTEALGQDPSLRVETEQPGGPVYDRYFLRPEPELRPYLWRIKQRVLLKPISEVQVRSVENVLREFDDYGVQLVWIFRDPVNVWSSAQVEFGLSDAHFDQWVELWNEGNRSVVEALRGPYADRIAIIRYEDLIESRGVFSALCRFLGIRDANNIFWRRDEKKGRRRLAAEIQQRIESGTAETFDILMARRIRPVEDRTRFGVLSEEFGDLSRKEGRLEVREPAAAALAVKPDRPGSCTVAIESSTPEPESIQWVLAPVRVRAGRTYTAAFWARANKEREISFCVGQAHEPWDSLGLYERASIGPEWSHHRAEFTASQDDEEARFYFDLGGDPADVAIADASLGVGANRLFRLALHGEGKARLQYDPAAPGSVRVGVLASPRENPSDVQLEIEHVTPSAGESFTLSFRARAEAPRSIGVAVGRRQEPWTSLGLSRGVEVGPVWKAFHFEFRPQAAEPGRVYFDLGQRTGAVEIADVFFSKTEIQPHWLVPRGGSAAELEYLDAPPGAFRIHLSPAEGAKAQDVQLHFGSMPIRRNRRYALSFKARADKVRRIDFGVLQTCFPFVGMGLYHKAEIGPEWRDYYYEFLGSADDEEARVVFSLAGSPVAVDLADIHLRPGPEEMTSEEIARLERILLALRSPVPPNDWY